MNVAIELHVYKMLCLSFYQKSTTHNTHDSILEAFILLMP